MFIGEYSITMDDKGRVAVPVKMRSGLGNKAVITRGLDKSLSLYTKEEWDKIAAKYASLPLSNAKSRAFARLMLGGAYEFEIDKQGRGMIPEPLRKFAHLNKKLVLAGIFNRIEVWDEKTWEEYKGVSEKQSNSIAESLSELGV
jgi:MraZ protein